MEIVDASLAILEELKRFRGEGVREIYLEDKTLTILEEVLSHNRPNLVEQKLNPEARSFIKPKSDDSNKSLVPRSSYPNRNKEVEIKVYGEKPLAEDDSQFLTIPKINLPNTAKRDQWLWLNNEIENCSVAKKELNSDGIIHFGRGSLDADIFFCGDSPSEEDDEAGSVFGAAAGKLLVKIIETMGFSEESVYLSNILHWRPKHELAFGSRPPSENELSFSLPYLRAQIEIINPKVIVALGKTATDGLLGSDPKRRLGDVRGAWNEFAGIPLMITYHPSYLIHNPSKSGKRKVWEDMLKVMDKLGAPVSEKQKGFFL